MSYQMRGKNPQKYYALETDEKYRKNFNRGTVIKPVFNHQRVRKGA